MPLPPSLVGPFSVFTAGEKVLAAVRKVVENDPNGETAFDESALAFNEAAWAAIGVPPD